mmetsp:Transcript_24899/g.77893  ORF Transcript_24899/g.77893 Transcript_24899/m.77893 type:complete len:223 (-) Transcript_24899:422-1090(-)
MLVLVHQARVVVRGVESIGHNWSRHAEVRYRRLGDVGGFCDRPGRRKVGTCRRSPSWRRSCPRRRSPTWRRSSPGRWSSHGRCSHGRSSHGRSGCRRRHHRRLRCHRRPCHGRCPCPGRRSDIVVPVCRRRGDHHGEPALHANTPFVLHLHLDGQEELPDVVELFGEIVGGAVIAVPRQHISALAEDVLHHRQRTAHARIVQRRVAALVRCHRGQAMAQGVI